MYNKKGVAFLTTIILTGLVVIAAAALSLMLLRDAYLIKRLKNSSQAYYLAEAGIEEGIEKLWSNSFSTSGFPISRNLGAGSISVTLDNSKWMSDNILLINSTGTVSGISRTLKTEVKSNVVSSLNYAILADGKVEIKDLSAVNCGSGSGVYSNHNSSKAVKVGGGSKPATVNGDASAVGSVKIESSGTVTGTITNGAPAESLPAFDSTFFNYYYNLANASGDVINGNVTFENMALTPANGVIYVNGKVKIEGSVTLTGCIIATKDIEVEENTTFSQAQFANFPALMSMKKIEIEDRATLNGLVYAQNDIKTSSESESAGDILINGSIMSKKKVKLKYTTLNYTKQSPPGMGANPIGWILNWNE